MNDRQLLEAAAKAAGVPLRVVGAEPGLYCLYPEKDGVAKFMTHQNWDPLTDDGDALRLAVKLQIHPETYNGYTVAQFVNPKTDDWEPLEEWGDDPYAATRRAIVRAAAAMATK